MKNSRHIKQDIKSYKKPGETWLQALRRYEACIKEAATPAPSQYHAAAVCCEHLDFPSLAIINYNKEIEYLPATEFSLLAEAYHCRAHCYKNNKQPNKAAEDFVKEARYHSDPKRQSIALTQAAIIFASIGQQERAYVEFDAAYSIATNPNERLIIQETMLQYATPLSPPVLVQRAAMRRLNITQRQPAIIHGIAFLNPSVFSSLRP